MKAFAVLFFALLAVAFAANECEFGEEKHKWDVGTDYNPIGKCISYKCLPGGGLSAKTCPEEVAIGCEKLPEDLTKPYPECCPKFKCA
ncbi:la1-like protein 13 isoform X2 [Hermetia illucens]|nr:la1-like protein 13 isoform X2 [Hermetia illucens]